MDDLIDGKVVPFLKKTLPKDRMRHVEGVMALAEELAQKHHLNPRRARLAGALHDIARKWKPQELVRYARRSSLKVPEKEFVIRHQPVLLHSYIGAHLARKMFGVRDREVLSAVEKHSLGSVEMSRFEKLIYVADLLAYGRKFPGVEDQRKIAFKDLDRAFLKGIEDKVRYLVRTGQPVHPECVRVWNHWIGKTGRKNKK